MRTTPGDPQSIDIIFLDEDGADLSQARARKLERVLLRPKAEKQDRSAFSVLILVQRAKKCKSFIARWPRLERSLGKQTPEPLTVFAHSSRRRQTRFENNMAARLWNIPLKPKRATCA
jgi:hypothetical protein